MNDTIKFIIEMVGYFLIYTAVDYNRPKDNKMKLFTKVWFIQIALVVSGVIALKTADGLF